MSTHAHNHKHVDHKEIAKKLQGEVDSILNNVDHKMLYAEFKQEEVFNIQNGESQEVVHNLFEERFMTSRPRKVSAITRIDKKTTEAAKKIGRFGRLARYLFKPLEY